MDRLDVRGVNVVPSVSLGAGVGRDKHLFEDALERVLERGEGLCLKRDLALCGGAGSNVTEEVRELEMWGLCRREGQVPKLDTRTKDTRTGRPVSLGE